MIESFDIYLKNKVHPINNILCLLSFVKTIVLVCDTQKLHQTRVKSRKKDL